LLQIAQTCHDVLMFLLKQWRGVQSVAIRARVG